MRTLCIWDLQCFQTIWNGCLFCTFWLVRNFYCGGAPHANYGKHSLNHHSQHCADCVYEIYSFFELVAIAAGFAHFGVFEIWTPLILTSIFKVFEMAVCFAHFGLFEIWTALILTMLDMVNIVQIIISNIAQNVYMRFTLFFQVFEIPVYFAHIG